MPADPAAPSEVVLHFPLDAGPPVQPNERCCDECYGPPVTYRLASLSSSPTDGGGKLTLSRMDAGGIIERRPTPPPPAPVDDSLREALDIAKGTLEEMATVEGRIDLRPFASSALGRIAVVLAAAPERQEGCEHEFFNPANEIVVDNGWTVCRKCGLLQPPTPDASPEEASDGD